MAKLFLLAQKIDFEKESVCILTHTNVAINEIKKRLKKARQNHSIEKNFLYNIAKETNGIFIIIENESNAIMPIIEEINNMEKRTIDYHVYSGYQSRFGIFLFLSLLFFIIEFFISTNNQKKYFDLLNNKSIVFANGPAGTGKTYIAVAKAISLLQEGRVKKIILSRPAVEAGEKLGFLPGDLKEKVDPFLRPIYDALYEMLPYDQVEKKISNNVIEIAPIAFMRGRTLEDCFIILDEAQNTTKIQMKMFLTRLGRNSQMVIVGDSTQIDLVSKNDSGLIDASEKLLKINDIGFITLQENDVVRHEVVRKIINAYEKK